MSSDTSSVTSLPGGAPNGSSSRRFSSRARNPHNRQATTANKTPSFVLGLMLCMVVVAVSAAPQPQVNGTSSPDYRVELVQPELLVARDDPQFMTFRITRVDSRGLVSPVLWEDLAVHATSRLHVVIVREGLQSLGHVHPEDFGTFGTGLAGDGRYRILFQFTRTGKYGLLLSFMPQVPGNHSSTSATVLTGMGEGHGEMENHPADVFALLNIAVWPMPGMPVVAPDAVPAATAEYRFLPLQLPVSGQYIEAMENSALEVPGNGNFRLPSYRAELQRVEPPSGDVRTGTCQTFRMNASETGSGPDRPVTDLEPFLDNAAHITAARSDLGVMMHLHARPYPTATLVGGESVPFVPPTCDGEGGHVGPLPQGTTFGPSVAFAVAFPEPGQYRLFLQSRRGAQLLVPAFTVDVVSPANGAQLSSTAPRRGRAAGSSLPAMVSAAGCIIIFSILRFRCVTG